MPRNGRRNAKAIDCPAVKPTIRAFGKPGPCVAAIASRSGGLASASSSAARATGKKFRRCARAANSGTTPPYSACRRICEETMLERTRPRWTTATLVSSQEVSIAKSMNSNHELIRIGHAAMRSGDSQMLSPLETNLDRGNGSPLRPTVVELRENTADKAQGSPSPPAAGGEGRGEEGHYRSGFPSPQPSPL